MADKNKRYVKEFEFTGGDAPERARKMLAQARENLFIVEYDGRSMLKVPLIAVIIAGAFGLLFAFPLTVAIAVGLTVLGFLSKLSVKVKRQ